MSEGEYLVAFLVEGRLAYKAPADRGALEAGQVLLAGEDLAVTLSLQRRTELRLARFNRNFHDRLAVLFYEPDFLEEFFPKRSAAGVVGNAGGVAKRPAVISTGSRADEVRALFDGLAKEFRERPARWQIVIQCRLCELFVLLGRLRGRRAEEGPAPIRAGNLNALIMHIQEHYTDEFSLEDLAARMNLAPAYFSRLFHEKAGQPLFEFINSIRIQKACQLLKRTNLSIIEIAYAVGYNNLSFFNRYFRRLMRLSPREYRNL